jgi:hypothetical protein
MAVWSKLTSSVAAIWCTWPTHHIMGFSQKDPAASDSDHRVVCQHHLPGALQVLVSNFAVMIIAMM